MNKNNEPDNLSEFFKLSMLASGTPAAYQKAISSSKEWKQNVCACSPCEAILEGMICKPSLNKVEGRMETDFPAALKAVLFREKTVCADEPFLVRTLVNCSSIDQIDSLLKHKFVSEGVGRDFHVITIHSPKEYSKDNSNRVLTSTVDGKETDSREAYEIVERIDDGYFGDKLPVIVFQVGMIGEGINVRSFNSVIVTTHSDRTAMQQVGRALRDYRLPTGESKREKGHANIYAFVENISDLRQLVLNLQQFDLTSDCFDWGKAVDVSTGSGLLQTGDEVPDELNEFAWSDIDELEIITILSASEFKASRAIRQEFCDIVFEDNADLVAEFMELMKSDPEYFSEYGIKNVSQDFARDSFVKEVAEKKEKKTEQPAEKECDEKNAGNEEKKKNTQIEITAEFIIDHLIALKEYLCTHEDSTALLWNGDRTAVFDEVFGNRTVSNFFSRMITDEFAAKLAGKAKNQTAVSYNGSVKENNECQETSVPKPICAAREQTPKSISDSSGTTSVTTIASRMLRWLTSRLRR